MARNITETEWQSLNVLSCSHCNLKTTDAAIFQAHPCKPKKQQITAGVSYSLASAKFTCSLCTVELSETEFREHLEGHMSLKPYVCSYCAELFATRHDVSEHLTSFHRQNEQIFVLKLSGKTKEIMQKAKNNGKEFYKPINLQLPKSNNANIAVSKNLTQNLATVPGPSQNLLKPPAASPSHVSSLGSTSSSVYSTVPTFNPPVPPRTHSHVASQPNSNTAVASARPQLSAEQRRYVFIMTQPQTGSVPTPSANIIQTQAPSCPSHNFSVPTTEIYWRLPLPQRPPGQVRVPHVSNHLTTLRQGLPPHRTGMQLPVTTFPNPVTQALHSTVSGVPQIINTRGIHMVTNVTPSSVNQISNSPEQFIQTANSPEQFIQTAPPGFHSNQAYLLSPSIQNSTGIQMAPPALSSILHTVPASSPVAANAHKAGSHLVSAILQTPMNQLLEPAVTASTEGNFSNNPTVSTVGPALSAVSINSQNPTENDADNIYKVNIQDFDKEIKSSVGSDNGNGDFAQSVGLQTHQEASSSAAEVDHEHSSAAVVKSEDSTDGDTDSPMQIRIENIMSLSLCQDAFQQCMQDNAAGTITSTEPLTENGSNITEHQTETGSNITEHQTETGNNITERQSTTMVSNSYSFLHVFKGYFLCLVCHMKWCADSDSFFKHIWGKHTHKEDFSCCPTGYSPYCARLKAVVQAIYDRSQETMPDQIKSYFTPKSSTENESEDASRCSSLSGNSSSTRGASRIETVPQINSTEAPSLTVSVRPISAPHECEQNIPAEPVLCSIESRSSPPVSLIPDEHKQMIEENHNFGALTAGSELDTAGNELNTAGSELDTAGSELDTAGNELDTAGSELDTAGNELDTAGSELDTAGSELDTAGNELDTGTENMQGSDIQIEEQATDEENTCSTSELRDDLNFSHENVQSLTAIDLSSAAASNSDHHKSNNKTNTYEDISDDDCDSGIRGHKQGTGSVNYSLLESLYSDEMPLDLSKKRSQAEKSHDNVPVTPLSVIETAFVNSVTHIERLSLERTDTSLDSLTITTETAASISVPQSEKMLPENKRICDTQTALSTAETALSTTGTALSTTETALSTAGTALSTAETALSTTGTALSTAETALSTAETALSTAETALSTTETGTALSTVETALSTAGTPLSTTETPLSTTEAAVENPRTRTERLSTESTGMGDDDDLSLRCFYVCGICLSSWPKAAELEAHIQEAHALQHNLPCSYCEFRCSSSTHLIQHMDDHITINNRKTFSCSLLENSDKVAQFENNDMKFIIRMLKTSLAENNVSDAVFHFVCNMCQSEFEDLDRLGVHLQESLLKVIGCKHCESFFLNSFSWQKHMATEHVDLPRMYCIKRKLLCFERKMHNNLPQQDSQEDTLCVSNTERDAETTVQENQCHGTDCESQTTPSDTLGKIEIDASNLIDNSKVGNKATELMETHSNHEGRDDSLVTCIQAETQPEPISTIPKLLDLVKSSKTIKSVLMSAVSMNTGKVSDERGTVLNAEPITIERRRNSVVVEQCVSEAYTGTINETASTGVVLHGLIRPVTTLGNNKLTESVSEVAAVEAVVGVITTVPLDDHCLATNSASFVVEQAEAICGIKKSRVRNDACSSSIGNTVDSKMVANTGASSDLDQAASVKSRQGCDVMSGSSRDKVGCKPTQARTFSSGSRDCFDLRSRASSFPVTGVPDFGDIATASLEPTETRITLDASEQNRLEYAENTCLPVTDIGSIDNRQESGLSSAAVLENSLRSAVQCDLENRISNVVKESEEQAVSVAMNEKDSSQMVLLCDASTDGGNNNIEMQTDVLLSGNIQHRNEAAGDKTSFVSVEDHLNLSVENRHKSVEHRVCLQMVNGASMVDQACKSAHDSEIGMDDLLTEPSINDITHFTSAVNNVVKTVSSGSGGIPNPITNSLNPDHEYCHPVDLCSSKGPVCTLLEPGSDFVESDDILENSTSREYDLLHLNMDKTNSNKEERQAEKHSAKKDETCEILNNKNSLISVKDRLYVSNDTSSFMENAASGEIHEANVLNSPSHGDNLVEENNNTDSESQPLVAANGSSHTETSELLDEVSIEEDFSNSVFRCKCGTSISCFNDFDVNRSVLPEDKSLQIPTSMCVKCRLVAEESLQPDNTAKHVNSENADSVTSKGSKLLSEKAVENCLRALKRKNLVISAKSDKISRLENVSINDVMCTVDTPESSTIKQTVQLDHSKLFKPYSKPCVASGQSKTNPAVKSDLKGASRQSKSNPAVKSDLKIAAQNGSMLLSESKGVAHDSTTSDGEMLNLPCKRKPEAEQGEGMINSKQIRINSEKNNKPEGSVKQLKISVSAHHQPSKEIPGADVTAPDSAHFKCSVCTLFTSQSYTKLKQHVQSQHPQDKSAKVCRIRPRSSESAAGQAERFENATLLLKEVKKGDLTKSQVHEDITARQKIGVDSKADIENYSTVIGSLSVDEQKKCVRLDKKFREGKITQEISEVARKSLAKVQNSDISVSDSEPGFKCSVCMLRTSHSYTEIRKHVKSQHPSDKSAKVIKIGPKCLHSLTEQFVEHEDASLKEVNSIRPKWTGMCACRHKKCDFTCEWDLEKMKEHINSKHPYYSCGYCKAPYTSRVFLTNHLNFVHKGKRPSIVSGTIAFDQLFKCVDSSYNGQSAECKDITSQTPAKRKKQCQSSPKGSAKKFKANGSQELNSLEIKKHTSSETCNVNMTGDRQNQPPEACENEKTSKGKGESQTTVAQALKMSQSTLAHSKSESILEHFLKKVSPMPEHEAGSVEKQTIPPKNAALSKNGDPPLLAKTDRSVFKNICIKLPQFDLAAGSQPSSSKAMSTVLKENLGEAETLTSYNNMSSTFAKTLADTHRVLHSDSLHTKKTGAHNAASSSFQPAERTTSMNKVTEHHKSALHSSTLNEASKYTAVKPLEPSVPSPHIVRKKSSASTSKHIDKTVNLNTETIVESSSTIENQELNSVDLSHMPESGNRPDNVQGKFPEICSSTASTYMSDTVLLRHINAAASAAVTPVSCSKTPGEKHCGIWVPSQLETAAEGDHNKEFQSEGLRTPHSENNIGIQSGSKTESMCENTATTNKFKCVCKTDYPMQCTLCTISLKCLRDSERHYIRKHPKKDIKLTERKSGFVYSNSGKCLQPKDGKKAPTDSYLCYYCAFRNMKRSDVEVHVKGAHPGRDVKVFSLCKPNSHKHSTLSKETELPHKPGRSNSPTPSQYSCHICQEVRYSEFQFRLHLAQHSCFTHTTRLTTGASFLCHTCGYVANSSGDLAQHTGEHMSERRFKCFMCEFEGHHKMQVKAHIKSVHNKTVDNDVGIIDRFKQRNADFRPRLVNIDPKVCLIDPFRQHGNDLQKLLLNYGIAVLDMPGDIYTAHGHDEYKEYFDINTFM